MTTQWKDPLTGALTDPPPPPVRVLGIDPSLTSTGLAYASPGEPVILHRVRLPKLRGHERLHEILATVEAYTAETDVVIMEGVAYGAKGSALLDLAGLGWLIRHKLWELGVPYALVDPATRAKWLTGRGNAPKDDCLTAAVKRFPADLFPPWDGEERGIRGNDDADALTLAAMGCDYYGCPIVPMPADRTALLHATRTDKNRKGQPKIDWPQITRKAA